MNVKETVQKSFDVVTKKPVFVEVDVKPTGWLHKLLIRLKLKPVKVRYELRPLVVGNRYRLASKALNIPEDYFKSGFKKVLFDTGITEDMIYILAVCIQNDKNEPSPQLLEFIKWNFDDSDIADVLDAALAKIDVTAFMKSIILIKGTEILDLEKMSPTNQEELIAPGVTSEV